MDYLSQLVHIRLHFKEFESEDAFHMAVEVGKK